MRFSQIFTLALAGAASAQSESENADLETRQQRQQLEYTVVVKSINSLTVKSQNLIVPCRQLSIVNAPALLVGAGPWPKVILGLGDIVATGTVTVGTLGGNRGAAYGGTAADQIADAFRAFVQVHTNLLEILIGKAGFLAQIPFVGPPVAGVLKLIEGVVDTFANLLISTVQGAANTVLKTQLKSLDGTVDRAITCYTPDGGRKAKRAEPWAA